MMITSESSYSRHIVFNMYVCCVDVQLAIMVIMVLYISYDM